MDKYTINNINATLKLPFELFPIEVIRLRLEELKNADDNAISNFYSIENATKAKIRKIKYEENARYFTYIKLIKVRDVKYGLVGGKTNYDYPDLDFSKDYGNSKTSFARKYLSDKNLEWDDTIIIIEHFPTKDKRSDEEMALFIECFLQREFNLFNS